MYATWGGSSITTPFKAKFVSNKVIHYLYYKYNIDSKRQIDDFDWCHLNMNNSTLYSLWMGK